MTESLGRWLDLGARGAQFLARFVFPETCAGCGAAGAWMCELCELELIDISHDWQLGTSRRLSLDDTLAGGAAAVELRARFLFAGPARKAVHLLKYRGERARAEWFAQMMQPILPSGSVGDLVFVPIPLTERRQRKRGYNQSFEIATHLSRLTGIPVVTGASRVRETQPQVELDGIARLHNVRGAFQASDVVRDKHVILIDDVVTTGATMRECGRACYEAGALSVVGVAATAGTGQTR